MATKSATKPHSSAPRAEPKTTKPAAKAIPNGMHTVTPHIVCAGAAKAIDFYTKAFGAVELMRLPAPDGKLIHACVRIGDSAIMMTDEMPGCTPGPKELKGTPVTLHLYVEDADAFIARAEKAGAKVIMPVSEMFWGDRYGQVEDPFGHRWAIATHVRDLTLEEISEGAKKMMMARKAST